MRKRVRRAMVAALLAAGSAPAAAAGWFEARSDHFVIYAPGDADTARGYATRLERFDKAMRVLRKLPDRPSDRANPLLVYVLPDPAAVARLCQFGRRAAGACRNVAGFYEPRAGGSVAFTPRRSGDGGRFDLNAQTVLFHEYAHHFMYANYAAAYPPWFTEGFAEFNATARFDSDGSLGIGTPALHRGYGLVAGKPLPLEAMLAADNRKLTPGQVDALYGRGWLLTHYLTFTPARAGQLSAYLADLNAGRPSLDAARTAFGDLKTLDRDIDRYLLSRRLSYVRLPKEQLPIGTIAVRPLTAGEAAMMAVRPRTERGVDTATAATVAAQARTLAAPYPADPGVQTWLAEAEYDAGRDDLAEAAADRALAADPKAIGALLYKGRARLRRAAQAKATDPAVWREARGWFVKANRLEPDAAEPLMLFYDSFRVAKLRPTDNAIAGLRQAFALAPQDAGLRFRIAREDMRAGRRADARRVLAPLAFDPHGGADNAAARLIARIDAAADAALPAAADAAPGDDDSQ